MGTSSNFVNWNVITSEITLAIILAEMYQSIKYLQILQKLGPSLHTESTL